MALQLTWCRRPGVPRSLLFFNSLWRILGFVLNHLLTPRPPVPWHAANKAIRDLLPQDVPVIKGSVDPPEAKRSVCLFGSYTVYTAAYISTDGAVKEEEGLVQTGPNHWWKCREGCEPPSPPGPFYSALLLGLLCSALEMIKVIEMFWLWHVTAGLYVTGWLGCLAIPALASRGHCRHYIIYLLCSVPDIILPVRYLMTPILNVSLQWLDTALILKKISQSYQYLAME